MAAMAALDNAGRNGDSSGNAANNAPPGNSEIHPDLAAYLSEPNIPLGKEGLSVCMSVWSPQPKGLNL